MLIKLLRSEKPYIILAIPILVLLLWQNSILQIHNTVFQPSAYTGIFFRIFFSGTENPYFSVISGFSLLLINAFILMRLNSRFAFVSVRSFLPPIIYIMIMSSYLPLQRFYPGLCASTFIFIVIYMIFSFDTEGMKIKLTSFFNIGMLVSIASLLYPTAIIFIVFTWISVPLKKTFNWREWIFSLFGIIVPYIFVFMYQYMADDQNSFFHIFIQSFLIFKGFVQLDFNYIIFYSLFLLLLFFSVLHLLFTMNKRKISQRNDFKIFLILIAGSFLLIFAPFAGIEMIAIFSLPAAFFISAFLIELKNKYFTEIFFLILSFIHIYIQLVGSGYIKPFFIINLN